MAGTEGRDAGPCVWKRSLDSGLTMAAMNVRALSQR